MLLASIALVVTQVACVEPPLIRSLGRFRESERVCRNLVGPLRSQRWAVPRLRLLVTLDPRSATKSWSITDVAHEVSNIWSRYADVAFAGVEGNGGDAAYDDRVQLLILEQARSQKQIDAGALGWIDFLSPTRPVDTINVSLAIASSILAQGRYAGVTMADLPPGLKRLFLTRILAAGISHEIGHYVLRSSVHTELGLMRQRLPFSKILNGATEELRLLPGQVEVLEQRMSAKLFAETGNKGSEATP